MSPEAEEITRFKKLFLSKNPSIEDVVSARNVYYAFPRVQTEFQKILRTLESDKLPGGGKPEAQKRLGIAHWIEGRLDEAVEKLEKNTDAVSRYVTSQCLIARGKPQEARNSLEKVQTTKQTARTEAAVGRTFRMEGNLEEALKYLEKAGKKHMNSGEILYELGLCRFENGDCEGACESLDEALKVDPEHRNATFSLAYLLYQRGGDEEAVRLYEKCTAMRPVHIGAVANLAFIYEDMGRYDEAARWLQRLHEAEPSDEKIELLAKFASSCTNMYYDEERQRQAARRERLLAMPITDFELSIRSRKCLEDMDISTLGDLVNKTEAELLSFNNFGETSLAEVKSILKQKGLTLKEETPSGETTGLSRSRISQNEALNLTLEEAGLSTRVRKCLESNKSKYLKDVCEMSENSLLEMKDFGRASLRELKRRLGYYDLSLREE